MDWDHPNDWALWRDYRFLRAYNLGKVQQTGGAPQVRCSENPPNAKQPVSLTGNSVHLQVDNWVNKMPPLEDIAWRFVNRLDARKSRSPYCDAEYSGTVTRAKSHLLEIPGRGISFCTKVPEQISKLMQWLLDEVAFIFAAPFICLRAMLCALEWYTETSVKLL